jgi:hypothetical protein
MGDLIPSATHRHISCFRRAAFSPSLFVRLGRADRRELFAERGGFGLHVAHLGLGLGDLPQHALVRGAQRGQLPPLIVGEPLLGPCVCARVRVCVYVQEEDVIECKHSRWTCNDAKSYINMRR